jgi:hypothetical protein
MKQLATMKQLAMLGLVVGLTVSWSAAQPTTRPVGGYPGPGGGTGAGPVHGNRASERGWGPVTRDEQERALEFAEKHMPLLFNLIEETPAGSMRHRRLMRFAIERHRWLQRIERDQPDLYDATLSRLRSQDELFELARQYLETAEAERAEVRERLAGKMREVVEDIIGERQRRIENLKQMLEREVQQLERDRQNIDALTQERTERLLGEFSDNRPGGPPGEPTPSFEGGPSAPPPGARVEPSSPR